MKDDTPFWKRKTLEQMTAREWESLCDGCGRCCLNKLEEDGTGKIFFTDVACKLLDHDTCRCKDYRNRLKKVPDCVGLTPAEVRELDWLPPTCAYDRSRQGQGPVLVAPRCCRATPRPFTSPASRCAAGSAPAKARCRTTSWKTGW